MSPVTVSPSTATLPLGGKQTFTSTINPPAPNVVPKWSVSGSGTITPAGVYTASNKPGKDTVIATYVDGSSPAGSVGSAVVTVG